MPQEANFTEQNNPVSAQSSESRAARLIKAFFKFSRTRWHNAPASGLSQTETDILENISRANRHGKIPRVSDISALLRVSSPTVTQHLNNLEEQGFVQRVHSTEDKRNVNLSLTDKGTEALKSHWVLLENDFNEFVESIGGEASEELAELLIRAHEFFNEKARRRDNENLYL